MPTFTLYVKHIQDKTVEVEASTIEEAKEKVLDKCSHHKDDNDHIVDEITVGWTVEVYDKNWLEI